MRRERCNWIGGEVQAGDGGEERETADCKERNKLFFLISYLGDIYIKSVWCVK